MTSLSELATEPRHAPAATCTGAPTERCSAKGSAAAELMLAGETPGDAGTNDANHSSDRPEQSSCRSAVPPALPSPGPGFRAGDHRGKLEQIDVGRWHGVMLSTIHPSAGLRTRDIQARDQAYGGLVEDLTTAVRGRDGTDGSASLRYCRTAAQFGAGCRTGKVIIEVDPD